MKLINWECLEEMDKLIEQWVKVDAIITDPPYGTTACKWDSVIPFDEMWLRLNKLIKPNWAIVLFWSEPFSSALRMSNIKNYRYDWVWEKDKPTMFQHSKNRPMQKTECISVFSLAKWGHASQVKNRMIYHPQGVKNNGVKKFHGVQGKYIGKRPNQVGREYMSQTGFPNNIIKISRDGNIHPTQKPVALMEYLIKTYTNEWEIVLDFTMWSGSTGVWARNTNRKFIWIELDENYFNIAKKRIENE